MDAISEIFYYTISTNVNCHQLCRWWQFCFQQNSTLAHDACNTVKWQRSELSTSLLLIVAFNLTAQQWSPLVMRFRDSHINMSIKCKSARLKKSSSDWLKSHEVGYSIRVKMWSLCFFLFHNVVQRHYLGEIWKNILWLPGLLLMIVPKIINIGQLLLLCGSLVKTNILA